MIVWLLVLKTSLFCWTRVQNWNLVPNMSLIALTNYPPYLVFVLPQIFLLHTCSIRSGKFQKSVSSLSKLSDFPLRAVSTRKHTRSQFTNQVKKRASSFFALVHSDIWSPSHTILCLGLNILLSMTFHIVQDYFSWKIGQNFSSASSTFIKKLKLGLEFPYTIYLLKMLVNIYRAISNIYGF